MVKIFALPLTLTEGIIRLAGGNPFFIEEVVRSLFEKGAIIRREGGVEVTENVDKILQQIPDTIQGVLGARIALLKEETQDLLKVASVIGRSFSYPILSDVASEVKDIEGKLAYLSEIQLLQPPEQMGEVEYLFKHALTQEVAYESLPKDNRKKLHLRVADSIEKIFSGSLAERYGMLAYHYSCAEDLEKAEEYLIKAGEEALRSAASDEALHYYKKALQPYLDKSGKDADPGTVAMLEKNIALALYNRGQHLEAIKYFDKALDYYWGKLPKSRILVKIKLLSAILHFLIALYLPFLKFRKTPRERDIEVADLFFKKNISLSIIDAERFFCESLYLFKFISPFDPLKFGNGIGIFVTTSALFSFSGISFTLSRKVLDAIKGTVTQTDVRNYTKYEICETVHQFLGGHWEALKDYEKDLVDKSCRIGEIYDASQYLYWHALGNICQGSFHEARSIVDRLDGLFEVYRNDLSKIFKHQVNTRLLIESGRLDDAMTESEKGIDFEEKEHSGFWELHICQAWIHIMMGEIQMAQECLERADRIRLQTKRAPFQLSPHFKTQLEFDLYRLKESTKSGNLAEVDTLQRKALKSVKLLRKVARKVANHRTDSYRLTGAYYWAINKQKRALRWWHKAVQEGERLGARPQLARAYSEVGKCLLESKGKHMGLGGKIGVVHSLLHKVLNFLYHILRPSQPDLFPLLMKAEEYLENARNMKMTLESALKESGRVIETRGFGGR